jgi:hypothetical protein
MSSNFLWNQGYSGNNGLLEAAFNLLTTELESLASGSVIVSSVGGSSGLFTNSNTAQAILAELYLMLGNPGIGSALSSGANLAGWFLTSPDGGTTFESTSAAPPRAPDFIVPLPATTITGGSTQLFKAQGPVILPALEFKVLVQNNAGQTFGNGGTTAPYLKCAPYAMQY